MTTTAQAHTATPHSDLESLKRLWAAIRPLKNQVIKGVAYRFAQSFCLGLAFAVVIYVVGQLAEGAQMNTQWVIEISGLMLLSLIGQLFFGYLSARYCWMASFDLAGLLRLSILEKLRSLPLGFHLQREKGDTVSVLTSDMQMVESFMSDALPRVAQALGLPIAVLLYLSYLDWQVGMAATFSIAVSIPVYIWASRKLSQLGIERQDTQAKAASSMIEYVQGIAVIRAFNRVEKGLDTFRFGLKAFRNISIKAVTKLTAPLVTFGAIVMCGIPLITFVAGGRYLAGEIDITTILAGLILALSLYSPIVGLIAVMEVTRFADASLTRINRIMDAKPLPTPLTPQFPKGTEVCFEHVGFGYDKQYPVLNDVSFTVPCNTMAAIVGLSGSGKSTALHLLSRFWDVDQGKIMVGGVDIRKMAPETLHQLITVVFQDVYLFSGTVYDNIALGNPHATMQQIKQAAQAAQADEFIHALPHGYQTLIGDGGMALSGGERQRISIARAILKDAPIVLLDEATAAIDPTTERALQSALAALVENKTLIVVAHRLSTIQAADQIIVLDQGKVVESGTHESLRNDSGLYAGLWENWSQAANWCL